MIINKAFFESQKVQMFADRATTDEVVKYATELAGAEGITIAMMMYNTILQQLADNVGNDQYINQHHACELAFDYATMKEKRGEQNYNGERVWQGILKEDEEKFGFSIINPYK